ncbi:MAG TPA: 2-oxoglutarate dehydrogenase, E2 component, dihydrolipoamide succinyltransferase [Gemmatimonadaceae bacterium]|nr:2-oxoglutarate dehydrogenase, E2 component, dihydrolipoamide succinyltransferase [Gemmatimonadaceae bacterium]
MARVDVVMPQMGESIAEGTLSRWLKKVGDEVKRDEPMFEISTDKVDAEIPAPASGVLAEILVPEGQTVPVQTLVARLETEKGAAIVAPVPPRPAAAAAVTEPAPAAPAAPTPPAAGVPNGTAAGAGSFEERVRTRSSPLVRKMAAEHGIALAALQGSGIAGRVTRKDLLEFIEKGAAAPATPAAPAAARSTTPALGEPHAPVVEAWPGDVVEPMSRIRQLTAEHMTLSRRWNAHVTSFFEIDLTRIARIRAAKRAEFERQTGEKLTYLPFIIRAVTDGLKAFPALNAAVRGNEVVYRKQYNVGIAVALDWGLIVPVIKNADDLSLTGLTRQLNDLAGRARAKKLQPHEVQGASFTITNPGVFGSLMGTPIIPVPTSAILGVGAIEKRPKVVTGADGEDTIAIRTCAYFSISFDHRIVDGADADRFMALVKKRLETFPDDAL